MPCAAEDCREPSGNCPGTSHRLESGRPVVSVSGLSPEVTHIRCSTLSKSLECHCSVFSDGLYPDGLGH